MSDIQLNDVGHENPHTRGELLAASAIAQFYTFASRCMDWAKTTRSLEERAVYVQMGNGSLLGRDYKPSYNLIIPKLLQKPDPNSNITERAEVSSKLSVKCQRFLTRSPPSGHVNGDRPVC